MESIKKLENKVEGWLKPVPHLPTAWRKWMADNVWWITFVGVALSVLGVVVLIGTILVAMSLVGIATNYYGYIISRTYSGLEIFTLVVSLIFSIIAVVIIIKAINPLKLKKKQGWELLFLAFVVGVVASVVNVILHLNVESLITGLLSAAISAFISSYLLFEIRSYFSK